MAKKKSSKVAKLVLPKKDKLNIDDLVRLVMEGVSDENGNISISTAGGKKAFVKSVFENISAVMKKGKAVEVSGFGKFYPHKRKARNARNPMTGESVRVKAKRVAKFRPASALRKSL